MSLEFGYGNGMDTSALPFAAWRSGISLISIRKQILKYKMRKDHKFTLANVHDPADLPTFFSCLCSDEAICCRSHFSFYQSCDDRWKNSVRHNLSMNPYFRKGCKTGSGAGHLWTLADVEGRRVRRCHTAVRMGRPPQPSSGDGTAAETMVSHKLLKTNV